MQIDEQLALFASRDGQLAVLVVTSSDVQTSLCVEEGPAQSPKRLLWP